MDKTEKPIVGITIGDYNGIGPEIIIKTLSDRRFIQSVTPVIYGHSKVISYYRKVLNEKHFNFEQIKSIGEVNPKRVNVINCWNESVEVNSGNPTEDSGKHAIDALKMCVEDAKSGKINSIVTAPISKKNAQSSDFAYPGHTEYLTESFGIKESLMLLMYENFRVGVVTGHIPLAEVSSTITKELIINKLKVLYKTLKDQFGINKPKIAVLGLNPHAGEEGLLGKEEEEIIQPAIQEFKQDGKIVIGPIPADGYFGTAQYRNYDATLAMYHDQGLIPFKTLAFETGVNFTAGLPIPRTSPDHGTAFSIAGKNKADTTSFRAAMLVASDICCRKNSVKLEFPELSY
ncbi:MAG: 4-hydroxythreonine-4-phosphate dehydrogenase PdxA [Bacteroidota bacterium]